jgi:hypothetical protein
MRVGLGDAQFLDGLLKREGYTAGLGFPTIVEKTSVQPFFTPLFDYNRNINAGNPNRPLELGGLTFIGDEENLRKSGVVVGILTGVNGRHIVGEGRYIDFALGASYAHSPKFDIGISTGFANVCSRNHLGNNFYIDGCASTNRQNRELANNLQSSYQISTSKIFSTSNTNHHAATVGLRRFVEHNSYEQDQLQLSLSTARSNSFYSSVNVSLGEAVKDTLALKQSASATIGTDLFNKSLTATIGYSYSDGGIMLGFERNDTNKFISFNYAITPMVSISLGYAQNVSSIDYFSEAEPSIGIQLAPIRF